MVLRLTLEDFMISQECSYDDESCPQGKKLVPLILDVTSIFPVPVPGDELFRLYLHFNVCFSSRPLIHHTHTNIYDAVIDDGFVAIVTHHHEGAVMFNLWPHLTLVLIITTSRFFVLRWKTGPGRRRRFLGRSKRIKVSRVFPLRLVEPPCL